ncbi:MAG: substrate-binding domain-containing protein [Candidatus Izimaplasma sp.]|nr:substrate-binding domain-containing protein [Candidatus Izimaplasma bacterium]
MKKLIVLVFALVLLLPLAGCESQTIKIGVVLPDASEERWKNQDGRFFEEELDALGEGYEYEILFSEGDEAKEKTNVDALIAKGAEVIILTAEGSGAGAAQAANEAGVTLIAHDRMAKKDDTIKADYYTTFNSWEVGKAQGGHLVEMAEENGCSVDNKCDLAIFAGRVADWPNATYFFGGAMEEIQPNFDMFNIINVEDTFSDLGFYTEATFDDDAKDALQAAMLPVDTDWNAQTAATKAAALVATIGDVDKSAEDVYVLAPNDDTSAAIRQEFAKMSHPYDNYYTTGQDASNVALASLMGDPIKGKGTQTMTVFKDTSKLCADSVAIAKNVIDGNPGLEGLNAGPKIDDVDTAYTAIDTLTYDNPQHTYDLIFATGYKDEDDDTFSNIDFSPYK